VVDDLHGFQDRAGAELAVAFARRENQEVDDRRFLDRLRDREVEVPPEVADGLALDVLDERGVLRIRDPKVVVRDQARRMFRPLEVQPVPVDDGTTRQDQA
jgi:hypothetical protein